MTNRFLHHRGQGMSFVLDFEPPNAVGSVIQYFGADLGDNADLDALVDCQPIERWGARLDQPEAHSLNTNITIGFADAEGIVRLRPTDKSEEASRDPKGIAAFKPLSLVFPSHYTALFVVEGDWANEFRVTKIENAVALRYASGRGRHGHDRYPALILAEPDTTQTRGRAIAVVLSWSGNFEIIVERARAGQLLVWAGATSQFYADQKNVESDKIYRNLDTLLVHSSQGLNGLSQRLHRQEKSRSASKARPVHFNTWEAIYFDHDLPTLKDLASRAASLGVERFVLDDGWFKGRQNDKAALGDWTPDPKKYPEGLQPLSEHVRQCGMEFGIWVEPEMVNPDSDLYRKHPDWVFRQGNEEPLPQRNQLSLNLAKAAVREYLREAIAKLVQENQISYLKWDMNRDLTEPHLEGEAEAPGYVWGLYDLIDRIRSNHPELEIETCASGGGRCDYGILQRTDRVWVSDNNDALDRLRINRGASHFLPLRIMGTHVGPEICHTTGRRLSLDLRAHVAMFGHFGLELDIRQLSDKDSERLKAHIANYKRFRALIHEGCYWRIESHEPDHLIDAVTSNDQSEALLRVVRTDSKRLGQGTTAFIPGLDPDKTYTLDPVKPVSTSVESCLAPALREGTLRLSGRMLAAAGLSLYLPRPETSLLIHLKA
jgi:alpha-galactosidase